MTASSPTDRAAYSLNGVTQIFAVPFYFLDDTHLLVQTITNGVTATLTLGTDYTVSGANNAAGGEVTTLSALDGGSLTIKRQIPFVQLTDYPPNTPFPSDSHERALDYLTMCVQQLSESIGRALIAPDIGTAVSVQLPNPQAGSLFGWGTDASGNPAIVNTGGSGVGPDSITDANVAPTAAIRSSKLGLTQPQTGAVTRTLASKLSEYLSITDFGAVGDDVADDTAAVNACIAACAAAGKACFVPATANAYRLTSQISLPTASVTIVGEGAGVNGFPGTAIPPAAHRPGSWFHIDHAGIGFKSFVTSKYPVRYHGIGTIRNQPVPTGGAYTPAANDYDIYSNTDTFLENVTLLNPTKGLKIITGSRLFVNGLRGQPLQEGINLYETHDTCHVKGVHFWPFWTMDAGVIAYTYMNAKAFIVGEVDNPIFSDIFTIYYMRGMSCEASGTDTRGPGKIKLTNFDFESGGSGFYVDSACANVTGIVANGTIVGISNGPTGFNDIDIGGANAKLMIDNVECSKAQASCLSVTGANSIVRVGALRIDSWGEGGSAAAINTAATADVSFSVPPIVGSGTGAVMAGAKLTCPLGAGTGSTTTSSTGLVTVTHGLPITPRRVNVSPTGSANIFPLVNNITSTTFDVWWKTSTLAAYASSAANYSWDAEF